MESILIIGIFMSLMLSVLLLTKRERTISDIILSAYITASALTLIFGYLEILNRSFGYTHPLLINISVPFIMLLGPAQWLYVNSLISPNFLLKRRYLLLLIPFIAVFLLLFAGDYSISQQERVAIAMDESFKDSLIFPIIMALIAISNIGYTVWGLSLLRVYRKRLKSYFSTTEKIDLRWLSFLLKWALICYTSISFLYMVDSIYGFMPYNSLQIIGYTIASLFVIVLGVFGLREGDLFAYRRRDLPQLDRESHKYEKEDEVFVKKLLSYMKCEKPYLNSEITLSSLGSSLSVSPDYLSQIINGTLNMNFFDFINHYRIEEFKSLCKNPANRNYTIIALAYDSGFNSKATFNRVFKKSTGTTPSEYYRSVSLS
ncbi:MAG: helix-turn-helix domain-containing protein [Bacteroidales bacterium]|nr:helix-turn-helix domain-containing protein [Bacteroidales bacterium]